MVDSNFLAIGTTLSVVINFWIIKNALRPLNELSSRVDQVQKGDAQIDPQFLQPTDPDIYQLAATLDSLVKQLNERNLELRALFEKTKREALPLDRVLTICIDCRGTCPMEDYQWRAERKGSSERLAWESLHFARQGGIAAYRF